MSTGSTTIPAETARHVLWHYGIEGGYQPGSFTQKLLELLAAADPINTFKLSTAFPAEVEAVRMAKSDEDGIARLGRIARGKAPLACPGCGSEDGDFDLKTGHCDDCNPETKLLSALADGGWLDDKAQQLVDAYAALVRQRATEEVAA